MKSNRPTKKQKTQPNLILYSLGFEPDIIDKLLYLIDGTEKVKNKGIKDKHIIWALLYWKQYIPITEICVTFGISPKTFLNHYCETIDSLWIVCKEIMEKRYDELVQSIGYLKHPISKVHYQGFPGSVHDLKIADQIYTIKDQNGEPQYYNNGQIIRKHDSFPILVISTTYRGNLEHLNKIVLILCVLADLQETFNDGFDIQFDKHKLKDIKEKRTMLVVK
ncbi:hypothetical protein ACTFIY_010981 [Dictyostelium cf. discoideum]